MITTLFMAMSANGIIARPNDDEDFLSNEHWQDLTELVEKHGNMIVGRSTYEAVKSWDEPMSFDDFPNATKIVLTSDPNFSVDPGYLIATSPQEALEKLEKLGFESALVAGGSSVNMSFLQAGLLNELVINIEPVLVGEGKNLFAPAEFVHRLQFLSIEEKQNGILQLRYHMR